MSLIECLKLVGELKSIVSIGKLFQRSMTHSAKMLDLTELLQKYLKILYGLPLVEQDRNVKSHLGLHGQAQIVTYSTTVKVKPAMF